MEEKKANLTGYVCPRCSCDAPRWLCDFSYEELGLDGDGTVYEFTCDRCGIDFVVYEPDKTAENSEV